MRYKWEALVVSFCLAMAVFIAVSIRHGYAERAEKEEKHAKEYPGVDSHLNVYEDKTRGVVCYSLTYQSFSCVLIPKETK